MNDQEKRILRLDAMLRDHGHLVAKVVCSRLGVDERTVRRDLMHLRKLGAPLRYDRSRRLWYYEPGRPLPHPHAVFTLLQRVFASGQPLHPKATAPGRRQRLDLLSRFIVGLGDGHMLPDHDAVDSAAAALLAAMIDVDLAVAVGKQNAGGYVWIPNMPAINAHL